MKAKLKFLNKTKIKYFVLGKLSKNLKIEIKRARMRNSTWTNLEINIK